MISKFLFGFFSKEECYYTPWSSSLNNKNNNYSLILIFEYGPCSLEHLLYNEIKFSVE